MTTETTGSVATTSDAGSVGASATSQPVANASVDATTAVETSAAVVETAPESYTDFKAPEGKAIPADVANEVKTLAKDLGLTQDKAQKVFDAAAKLSEQHTAKWHSDRDAAKEAWADASRNDKEFGGEKLAENLAIAKTAMDATCTPEFVKILNESGLGNHPEMVRHFLKIAPAYSQDRLVQGGAAPTTARQSIARSLYPNNA